jgi:hypothetical protein
MKTPLILALLFCACVDLPTFPPEELARVTFYPGEPPSGKSYRTLGTIEWPGKDVTMIRFGAGLAGDRDFVIPCTPDRLRVQALETFGSHPELIVTQVYRWTDGHQERCTATIVREGP